MLKNLDKLYDITRNDVEMELGKKQKDTLFKLFLFSMIHFLLITLYLVISGISGDFDWTIERLTSSLTGVFIQILNLAILINGILIFIYIVILIILTLKN